MAERLRIRCIACGMLPEIERLNGPLARPEIQLQVFGGSEPIADKTDQQRGRRPGGRKKANRRGLMSYQRIDSPDEEAEIFLNLARRYEVAARSLRNRARQLSDRVPSLS